MLTMFEISNLRETVFSILSFDNCVYFFSIPLNTVADQFLYSGMIVCSVRFMFIIFQQIMDMNQARKIVALLNVE